MISFENSSKRTWCTIHDVRYHQRTPIWTMVVSLLSLFLVNVCQNALRHIGRNALKHTTNGKPKNARKQTSTENICLEISNQY